MFSLENLKKRIQQPCILESVKLEFNFYPCHFFFLSFLKPHLRIFLLILERGEGRSEGEKEGNDGKRE